MDSHQYLRGVNIKDVTTVSEIPSELKPYTMAIGAVVILLGMLLAFQGKRTYRIYAACTGFLMGATAAFFNVQEYHMAHPLSNYDMVQLIACVSAGVLGMLLFTLMAKLVVLGLGVLLGLSISTAIMHVPDIAVLLEKVPRTAVVCIIVAVVLILTVLLQNYILILVTALVGSVAVIVGIDLMMQTGLNHQAVKVLSSQGTDVFTITDDMRPLIYAWPCIFVLGAVVQFGLLRRDGGCGGSGASKKKERERRTRDTGYADEEKGTTAALY